MEEVEHVCGDMKRRHGDAGTRNTRGASKVKYFRYRLHTGCISQALLVVLVLYSVVLVLNVCNSRILCPACSWNTLEPRTCSINIVTSRWRPELLGVGELLTRTSTDLSDVFVHTSEVTSHKAAVIPAVDSWTPGGNGTIQKPASGLRTHFSQVGRGPKVCGRCTTGSWC